MNVARDGCIGLGQPSFLGQKSDILNHRLSVLFFLHNLDVALTVDLRLFAHNSTGRHLMMDDVPAEGHKVDHSIRFDTNS